MKDIEILPDASGVPSVSLHGEAKSAAASKGVAKIQISLSHSEVRHFIIVQFAWILIPLHSLLPSRLLRPRHDYFLPFLTSGFRHAFVHIA